MSLDKQSATEGEDLMRMESIPAGCPMHRGASAAVPVVTTLADSSTRADEAKAPPGPGRNPLFILQYLRDPLRCYQKLILKYGDPFSVPFLGRRFVVTGSPEGVREIFTAPRGVYGPADMGMEVMLGQYSLLLMAGEPHYQARKRLNPTFTTARTQCHVPLMQQTVLDVFRSVPRGKPTTAIVWTRIISMRVILKAIFGILDEASLVQFEQCFHRFHGSAGFWITFFPFMRRNFGSWSPWSKFTRARTELYDLIERQIEKTRGDPDHAMRDGVLNQLIASGNQDPAMAMTNEEIRDHLFTIVMAGHESTASGLAWALYWLHRHPEVQKKLLAEIEREAPDLDPQRLVKLSYLEAVCKETLRIHPLIPDVARCVAAPFRLNGCKVEPGNMVIASVNLVHHREDIYPDPDAFRPERFIERTLSTSEFFPFGGGHRHCLGNALGMQEMKIVLATLIRRFEIEVDVSRTVRPTWNNAVRVPKGGVKIRVLGERA